MLGKVAELLGGNTVVENIVGGVGNFIKGQFPEKLSEEDRTILDMKVREIANQEAQQVRDAALEDQVLFDTRIRDMEGTAKDLKTIPVIGAIIIFLRGVQRPFWGFGTFYFDWLWFTDSATWSDKQETALIVINLLVLGFLFGERAIQNVLPLITRWLDSRRSL